MAGRKPDYNLSAMDKKTEMKGQIGGAWTNPNRSISIRLNPWVVLDGANKDLVLTLFVNDGVYKHKATCEEPSREVPDTVTDTNEEAPF